MTVINPWWRERRGVPGERELWAFVQCDGCLPPSLDHGPEDRLRRAGWRFERLDLGPHYCASCRSSGRRRNDPRRRYPPTDRPVLPNVITVGAMRCGTTSLHRYLAHHPEINASSPKEVNFFQGPDCLDRLSAYATFFEDGTPVRLESSVYYTWFPLVQGVPERINEALSDVKLIYLVRDPVERTLSHHLFMTSVGSEIDPFEQVLAEFDDPYNPLVAAGKYAMQLNQYIEHIPIERILVIDQDELRTHRDTMLRRVFRFLEVDEGFSSPAFELEFNARAGKRVKTSAFRALKRSRAVPGLRRVLPQPARQRLYAPVKRLTTRTLEHPELSDEMRVRLREVYRPDADRLRAMTGQEFASWQI